MPQIAGYTILQTLYQGRNSIIYRCKSNENTSVIIKAPITHLPNLKKSIDKLCHEAKMCQQITSKYVIKEELKTDDKYGYILIEEDTQAETLADYIPPTGFEVLTFLKIALQLAEGLQDIHQSNVIHNDIKPNNIIWQPETEQVKYIDFGSASLLHQHKQLAAVSPYFSEGSLAYISPEQTGRINRLIDYRTDFYSLGVTLYQLLCGKLPFLAKDVAELVYCHLAKQPLPPHQCKPSIPEPISNIVMKLLNKDAENRYQSAHGILADLKKCFAEFSEKGKIAPFELAQQDIPEQFCIPQKLYGRKSERERLESSLERISQGGLEVCMLTGLAGTGKTMLVNEIQPAITLKKGFFLKGKFEQLEHGTTYSAISQALQSWVKQLLTGSEEELLSWKKQLLDAFHNSGQLLIDLVPDLELIIGQQPLVPIVETEQTKNRFHLILQNLIQIIAQPQHPLVLFLDDLQWADKASLQLLATLMPLETNYLLLIGAYRDNEVNETHPLMQTLNQMTLANIPINTINLSALQFKSVHHWITDAFKFSPAMSIMHLSTLIYKKTQGNPFFIKTFLQNIYEQNLITFTGKGWKWNLEDIQQLPATDNVIEFMTHQLTQLPLPTQTILQFASCLGHEFSLNQLQQITKKSAEQLLTELQPLMEQGLLLQAEEHFQFAHDRIQEAAYRLITEENRPSLHLNIGQLLQITLPSEPTAEQLFEVVNHLNKGKSLIIGKTEYFELAKLNIKASQKEKNRVAYPDALNYLQIAKELLETINGWIEHFHLTYFLHKELLELEYLNSHFEQASVTAELLITHAQSILEQVDVYNLLIIQKTMAAQYQAAINIGHQALKLLNVDWQSQNLKELLSLEFAQVKENLKSKTSEILLNTAAMSNIDIKTTMKLLHNLLIPAYFTDQTLHDLLVARMVNLSITHGNSEESAMGYATYGMLLVFKMGDIQQGHQLGSLALQLSDQFRDPTNQCRTYTLYTLFIHHWSKPITQVETFINHAEQFGLIAGEFQFLGYVSLCKAIYSFYKSTPLTDLENDLNKLLQLPYNRSNKMAISMIHAIRLVVLNLIGQSPSEMIFQDTLQNDIAYQAHWQQEQNFEVLFNYFVLKAQALYIQDRAKEAFNAIEKAKKYLAIVPGYLTAVSYNYYYSLILLSLHATADTETQQHYWQKLAINQQQMKVWADHSPENFLHKYLLIDAEMNRIQSNNDKAAKLYDQAIQAAQDQGFTQDHALASELAAKFWLARELATCAQSYLYNAYNSYFQWNAKCKYETLARQYSNLIKPLFPTQFSSFSTSGEKITLSAANLRLLDLASILKASQTISSDIDLPKLLHSIMKLIVQNAGAQQGAFLLEETGNWLVQAEYTAAGQINTLQRLSLSQWKNGACSVIDYVKRTLQAVLLGDAEHDKEFGHDPYIMIQHIKSVLCLPIIRHGRLQGILYIENNLAPYIFTEQHLQTLTILASQIAISLEIATLYESMRSTTEQLNLTLQSGHVGTWSWYVQKNKMVWDNAMYAIFGAIKHEDFTNTFEEFLALIYPEDQVHVKKAIIETMETKENNSFNQECRIINPDKTIRDIEIRGTIYRDREGKAERVLGIVSDITQRKQLEKERLQALICAEENERRRAKEAEEHQKKLIEFIDTVCHEIRNPMSGIYGSIEFMEQLNASWEALCELLPSQMQPMLSNLRQKYEEHIKIIKQCIEHQQVIINDVLDVSKIQAGKLALIKKPFQPRTIIEDTIKLFNPQLAFKKIELILSLPKSTLAIMGDPNRFKVILMNLISNAIKFTSKGHISISLQTQRISSTQVELTLSVKDTGIGLTPEEQSHLFQRFSRPISSQYEGSGLGLVIAKESIELMGGNIQVESKKGQGTEFTVHLTSEMAKLEEIISPAVSKKPTVTSSLTPPTLGVMHILIVEDNLVNQRVLEQQMLQAGYTYEIANNGKEAFEKWKQTKIPFDLILMDTQMPVMDGLEATRQIRKVEQESNQPKVPIVGLSAYARGEHEEKALKAGMNAYLTKPCQKEKLYRVIQEQTASVHEKAAIKQSTLTTPISLIDTDRIIPKTTQPTFWEKIRSETQLPKRIWLPKTLRNLLYPVLDQLAIELQTLNIKIAKLATFQDKISNTGWQLYFMTDKNEYWAVLNLTQETQADKLVNTIQQSGAQLRARKMISGTTYAVVIAFSPHIALSTEIAKVRPYIHHHFPSTAPPQIMPH